jgi:hypothetical protein
MYNVAEFLSVILLKTWASGTVSIMKTIKCMKTKLNIALLTGVLVLCSLAAQS